MRSDWLFTFVCRFLPQTLYNIYLSPHYFSMNESALSCSSPQSFNTTWTLNSTLFTEHREEDILLSHDTGKQPIRTRYLGHVNGYQPIMDQYISTVPCS